VRAKATSAIDVQTLLGKSAGKKSSFGGGVGWYKTREARDFQEAVKQAAWLAKRASPNWPSDPWCVDLVRIGYQLVDYLGDSDGCRKFIKDAMQGVLYVSDKRVGDGISDPPRRDGLGKRVEIVVELFSTHSEAVAQAMREEDARRRAKRILKKLRIAASASGLPRRVIS